ncbi:hypothetical protein [Saliphagus infecundisoli]|uniref:DUF7982 domain-containing protein n=1 Tax=Saliphagus infecundisoli TaxID=1849069 RepID=A0ABD5QE22_9EURY|nr:hypothetical protein [Saliphagus infecundisoli]
MSAHDIDEMTPETDENAESEEDDLDLAAQIELLAAENRRLRDEYARARQSRYRHTAIGLGSIGALAALGGLLFPDARDVLFALAATGLFGAVLTYYLTPGRFVAGEVGERVYAPLAGNEAAIADDLGLGEDRIYLPREGSVRLYVPQRSGGELPEARAGPIVTAEGSRGLLLETTGSGLFAEFEDSLAGDLATAPAPLGTQLADGLVEGFELVESAELDADPEGDRLTLAVTGSAFGDADRFDHPVAAFVATGVATGLDRPVALEVRPGDDRHDWLVTCRWDLERVT